MHPAARLRQLLIGEREDGSDFEHAWERSLTTALEPLPHGWQREQWRTILVSHRSVWRRAYELQPPAAADASPLDRDGEWLPQPRRRHQVIA